MSKKNLLSKFAKNALTNKESIAVKGGRNPTPVNTGSYGFVNWDDVEIREPGIVVASYNMEALTITSVKKR